MYWALHQTGLVFWNSAPFDLAYFLFTLLTNGVALALTIVLLDAIFCLAGVTPGMSVVYAFILPLGTWLLPYGLVVNNHGISALLVTYTAWLLFQLEFTTGGRRLYALLGLTLGLLIAIEVTPIVSFVPVAVVYLLTRPDLRTRATSAAFALGLLLPLVAHAVMNMRITGDIVPGGFHNELFAYPGSSFDASSLSGNFNHQSIGEVWDYAWRALLVEKGFFSFAPILFAGLLVGTFGWKSWRWSRGIQWVLLGGSVLSLSASLLMSNNFGGLAVGFRHATYLAPALLILLLPIMTSQHLIARASIVGVAALSTVMMFVFAVPRPWFALQFPGTLDGVTWKNYVPIVAQAIGWLSGVTDGLGNPR